MQIEERVHSKNEEWTCKKLEVKCAYRQQNTGKIQIIFFTFKKLSTVSHLFPPFRGHKQFIEQLSEHFEVHFSRCKVYLVKTLPFTSIAMQFF